MSTPMRIVAAGRPDVFMKASSEEGSGNRHCTQVTPRVVVAGQGIRSVWFFAAGSGQGAAHSLGWE